MNACKFCGIESVACTCPVCGNVKVEAIDAIVKATTAFDTLAQMVGVMRESGYVPTCYGDTRRKRKLIRVLKALGFRVWGNKGKNW